MITYKWPCLLAVDRALNDREKLRVSECIFKSQPGPVAKNVIVGLTAGDRFRELPNLVRCTASVLEDIHFC